MNQDPDSPRTIKRDKFEEQTWKDLIEELGRHPTKEEYELALDTQVDPPDADAEEDKFFPRPRLL